MTTYERGNGWAADGFNGALTEQQQGALRDVLEQQEQMYARNPAAVGLGGPIYRLLLSYIANETVRNGQFVFTPKPGVSQAVFNWISAAPLINAQFGFSAQVIQQYTIDGKVLRDGKDATVDGLNVVDTAQRASNQIAFNVASDILDHDGTLPGIEGLGVLDAGAAASVVFKDAQFPGGDYAGWAGTLLFPYLGEPQYYENWLLNAQTFVGTDPNGKTITFKNISGTYDLVAAIEASENIGTDTVIKSASGDIGGLLDAAAVGLKSFFSGPPGATANPSSLVAETNNFFQTYYGLKAGSSFLPGRDLPFSQGPINSLAQIFNSQTSGTNQYVVGTIASNADLEAKNNGQTVIVGGPNDDIIHGTASGDDLIDGGGGNNTIYAGGGNDIIFGGSDSGNNVLFGDTTNQNNRDVLVGGGGNAAAANAVAGNPFTPDTSAPGADTLNAGVGDNILIGGKGSNVFNIDATQNIKSVDVVWDNGGTGAINITGQAQVMVVNAPGATLASVENLDIQKLYQQVAGFTAGLLAMAVSVPIFPNEKTVIVINATSTDTLTIDGLNAKSQYADNFLDTFDNDFSPQTNQNFVRFSDYTPNNALQSWIVGLDPGDFGINSSFLLSNLTPTVDLAKDQVQSSNNANGGPGGGPDPSVIDQSSVFVADVSDTLVSINAATASAFDDTLVAANGADTLTISGYNDTLIGDGAGSTLISNGSFGQAAAYAIDNVTVDLNAFGDGSAQINGSSTSDTLVGVTAAEALGANDTLTGSQYTTLTALTAGNTLIGEGGATLLGTGVGSTLMDGTAWYQSDNSVVNLVTGTANVGEASTSDTLVGVQYAVVSGQHSTIIGDENDTLAAYGGSDTLIAGAGVELLEGHGSGDTLIGGSGTDYLVSDGSGNTLIAGTGSETLSSTGTEDTLIGNGSGSQLITTFGGTAAYTIDNVVVDLATNLATVQGASVSDTLQNITAAEALGSHDTLIGGSSPTTLTAAGSQDVLEGGSGATTFISDLNGNTLIAGTGLATVSSSGNNATINLGAGTEFANGSRTSDTLIGISQATISNSGTQDTLIGGSIADILVAGGDENTLIAGSGAETLTSQYGTDNTLIAGSGVDTLSAVGGFNNVLLAGNGASETLSASGFNFNDTLVAGSGSDTLSASGTSDTLLGGTGASILSASGSSDSLVAGTGNTLLATGSQDTLFGNGTGNTLNGTSGTGALAAYTGNDITIDLATGTAGVNGSGTVDTLLGFTTVAALGSNDTIIDSNGGSTLFSDGAGNTLIGGIGETVAAYSTNNLSVNLSTGTAGVNGSGINDSLIGIAAALVSGSSDTIIAGNGADLLSSSGSDNTLIAGAGVDTLITSGASDTLIGGTGADTLSASGTNAVLLGGGGPNVLSSTGSNNTLVAGAGTSTLSSSGSGNTLFGNANGGTLNATSGTGTTAAYALNDVVVDVAAGTATVGGTGASDTLTGFSTFAALGSDDTLIDGNSGSTLFSNASGNTLEGGTGETVAAYTSSDLTINLAAGTAGANGASASDTLIGIHGAYVSGSNDVLLGDSSNDLLSSSGSGNTLIAGAAVDTLLSTGNGDTLIGNLLGSTLENSTGSNDFMNAIAAYSADNVTVDLSVGTASINGSGVSDQLIEIRTAEALGSHDTLSGGSAGGAGYTFISNGNDNTLTAGEADITALYEADNVTVNLVNGTAGVNGSTASDTLIGIMTAIASGANDTLVSGGTGNSLSAENTSDVAAYAVDNLSIDVAAGTAGINGSGAEDTLTGFQNFVVSGSHDSVTGGQTAGSFEATGSQDTLIAGASKDTLTANGTGDTLVGNLAGATLQASPSSTATVALYTFDNVTIDLGSGTASSAASTLADTLIGITDVSATGAYDTLLAGGGTDTLSSSGSYNSLVGGSGADVLITSGQNDTLEAGSGANTLISSGENDTLFGNASNSTLISNGGMGTTAAYQVDNVTVNLATATAKINGAGSGDTLSGITEALVGGSNDTAIAAASGSVLLASGTSDTLIGGAGADTLSSSGTEDSLLAGSGNALLLSNGSDNFLLAASGSDTLASIGVNDLLQGGSGVDTLYSGGFENTLVAGTGSDTLISVGTSDTLFGNAAGSSLVGTGGTGAIAAYAMNNVTVNLATDTATVNDSGISDTLVGIGSVLLTGSNDTVIGGTGASTLYSNGSGNTLIGGTGQTTVVYTQDDVTVDLATSQATVNGTATRDTLSGISMAEVAGSGDTLIAGAGADVLSSSGTLNTLIAGAGADTLSSSGTGDSLVGGSGTDLLLSSGHDNALIAGSAADSLVSTGVGDTLIGNTAGSTLDGSGGVGAIADYTLNNVTVNLANGTATVNSSSIFDTLVGISAVMASGTNDTLIGGSGATTLFGNGGGNTLVAGSGQTTVAYMQDAVSVNLATQRAQINGSSTADTLVGITNALVSGENDTLIGGSAGNVLSSDGLGNTLIAGTGVETLSSSGAGDTLIGNAAGSTLDGSNAEAAIAAYTVDDVTVDLTAGTATVNGASVSDALVSIGNAAALGTGDTLIGGTGATTLYGDGAGNTLIAGAGSTTAAYQQNNATVDLATESASVAGSSDADTLVGITSALVSGTGDVVIGGSGAESLASAGTSNTLIAGGGVDSLSSTGTGDTLIGGAGADILSSGGFDNSLVAGTGVESLASTGFDDTLFGNIAGSTLDGSGGIGAIAAYTQDNVTVNLAARTAGTNGSSVVDTLIGIDNATISGAGETLIGDSGTDTLVATGSNDVVEAGSGIDTLVINGGPNTFVAGSGADTFVVQSAVVDSGLDQPQNLIRSFNPTNGTIDLTQIAGVYSFADLSFSTVTFGSQSYLQVTLGSTGQAIMLSGVSESQLTPSDFSFQQSPLAPTVAITSSAESSNAASQTIVGMVTSNSSGTVVGQTVALTDNRATLGTATIQSDGTFTAIVTLPNQGANAIIATVTDSQGNTGVSTAVVDTLDSVAPTVTITSGAEASRVAGQTITGTVASGGAATVVGQTVTLTDNGMILGTGTVQSGGMFSAHVTLGSQGSNSIIATVTDSFGNTATSAAVVDTLDNVAPTITITSASEASNVAAQTIAGTVTTGGAASVVGRAVTLTDNGTTVGTATVLSNGSFASNVTLPSQGANAIVATITDSYGNTGTSAAVIDTLDNVAPTVTITSAPETSDVAGQTITGAVASGGAATVIGQTVTLTDNGATLGAATVQSDGSFSANITLLGQGANSIVASVSDSFGNAGASSPVVDTMTSATDESVAITSEVLAEDTGASDTDFVTMDGEVTVTGTATAGSTVAIYDGSTDLGNATVSGASWTFSTDLGQGTHQLDAIATGSDGSTATSAPGQTIVVDDTPPQPSLNGFNIDVANNTIDVTTTGTSEAGSTIQFFIGPVNGADLIGSTTANASGDFSFDLGHLLDFGTPITAVATDLAGNVGTYSAPLDEEPLFYAQGASGSPVSGHGDVSLPWQQDGISTVYVNAPEPSAYLQGDGYGNVSLQLFGDAEDDLVLPNDLSDSSGALESGVQEIVFSGGTVLNLDGPLTFTWLGNTNGFNLSGTNFGTNVFDVTASGGNVGFGNTSQGGTGKNVINYALGSGYLTASLNGGTGVIDFGPGVTASDIDLQADGYGNLFVTIAGDTTDSIVVRNDLIDSNGTVTSGIQQLNFSDGTSINLTQDPLTFTWLGNTNGFNLSGTNFGTNVFDVTTKGNVGFGNASQGGTGKNIINYALGSGYLTASLNGGTGVIDFGPGVTASDIDLQADGYGNLFVTIAGNAADSITIGNDLADNNGGVTSGIQQLNFSDGTSINLAQNPLTFTWLGNTNGFNLSGTNFGTNVFDVTTKGNVGFGNTSQGGTGKNVINYALGSGYLTASLNGGTGVIDFGPGVTASDIDLQADGYGNLFVTIAGDAADSLAIGNDLADNNGVVTSGIQQLNFSDGTSINLTQDPLTFTWLGNTNGFNLSGTNFGTNVFDVTKSGSVGFGNASRGGTGQNIINYALGSGYLTASLNGGTGVIDFGPGVTASDIDLQADGYGNLFVTIAGDAADSITIGNDLADNNGVVTSGIQQLNFGDGTNINLGPGSPLQFTWVGTPNASLSGSNFGANTFILGGGSESVTGGGTSSGGNGNNTYFASSSTGQVTINANAAAGSTNELGFTGAITDNNLWFERSGNNLEIDLIGTQTQINISGWFNGGSSQLQEITAGGLKIDSQVSQLVQAMATYSSNNPAFNPTASGISTAPNDSNLQSAIAAAWHS